jgi:sortase A
VALVCAWILLQLLYLSDVSQSREQEGLYADFRGELAAATAPLGGVISPGTPVALVDIEAIDVHQVVVEGTAAGDLRSGPGHRRDTVLPGQSGVSVIYGRARTYGGPFGRIAELTPGDRITTVTAQGAATYEVEAVRRAGDLVPQPVTGTDGRITLVSAEGAGPLSALAAGEAVYVDAKLVTDAFTPPVGRAVAVPSSELVLAVNAAALPMLVLLLAGLVGAAVAVVLVRGRLPAAVAWTVAVPIVLALAWATTDALVDVLPNLL